MPKIKNEIFDFFIFMKITRIIYLITVNWFPIRLDVHYLLISGLSFSIILIYNSYVAVSTVLDLKFKKKSNTYLFISNVSFKNTYLGR